ncbi:hypothetical protein QQY66_48150 [Streptomyces sp. DG2A-72]|uniref:hypothetical protein n=1 Tax=Streptomyces sp. DG2A-72 TaxID=3051386 RepID=UPI00265BE7C5|nr:hypothetical protein [Streptomyces sp. DG2A-72]MDO0939105.1 hypothetical protein [Streptomyces sp. DG2A-72]
MTAEPSVYENENQFITVVRNSPPRPSSHAGSYKHRGMLNDPRGVAMAEAIDHGIARFEVP